MEYQHTEIDINNLVKIITEGIPIRRNIERIHLHVQIHISPTRAKTHKYIILNSYDLKISLREIKHNIDLYSDIFHLDNHEIDLEYIKDIITIMLKSIKNVELDKTLKL